MKKKGIFARIPMISAVLPRTRQAAPGTDAAVLAIIDPLQRILICRRADHLNSFPGEACLPGGKSEKQEADKKETALREAEEEIGIDRSLITVQHEFAPIRAFGRFTMHVVVGTVNEVPQLSINHDEVAETMWVPLESFLMSNNHWTTQYDRFNVHVFEFPQFDVFGFTADLCMLIAIRELGKSPEFDINNELTSERMAHMTSQEIIDRWHARYDGNVRSLAKKQRKAAKL